MNHLESGLLPSIWSPSPYRPFHLDRLHFQLKRPRLRVAHHEALGVYLFLGFNLMVVSASHPAETLQRA